MAENRLEIILSAKTTGIEKSLADVDARVRKTAKGISGYLSDSGDGAKELQDALKGVEFGTLADGAKSAAKDVRGAFDKTGDDLKASFAKAGDSSFEPAVNGAKSAVKEFAAEAKKGFAEAGAAADKAKSDIGGVDSSLSELSAGIKNLNFNEALGQAGDFAQKLADASNAALGTVKESADGMRDFERSIKAAFVTLGDQKTIIQAGKDIRKTFGEDIKFEGIAEGAQAFTKFGASAKQAAADLNRAAKVARADGKEIANTSEILAEAFSKDAFDAGIGERIRGELGIGGAALEKYGAKVDANKQLILEGIPAQEAFRVALRKFIDESERYGGVAQRTSDGVTKLQQEQDKLSQSAGEAFNNFRDLAAGPLTKLLQLVNELPDGVKGLGLALGLAAGPALGLAAQLAQVYTAGKILTGGLTAISAASATAGTAVAGSTSLMATGAAEATAAFTAAQGGATAAATAAGGLAVGIAAVGAAAIVAAVGVNEYNKGVIDAEQAQSDLLDTQSLAAVRYKDLGNIQRKSAADLIAEAAAIEDNGQRRAQYSKDLLAYQQKVDDAREAGDKQAEASAQKELDLLEAARSASDARVTEEENNEAAVVAFRKKAYDESAKFMEDYTAKAKVEAEKRAAAEEEAERGRIERLKALLEEEAALKRSSIALDRDGLSVNDSKIAALEKQLDAGKDVTKQIGEEVQARAAAEKKLLDQEAALDRIAIKQKANADAAAEPDKANREKIYANAGEREAQLNRKLAADKAKIDAAADGRAKEANAKRAAQVKATADKAAKDAKEAAKKQAEDESQLVEIVTEARAKSAEEAKTAAEERLQKLKDETAELEKQLEIRKAADDDKKKQGFDSTIQGGAQSVADAFGKNSSGFGESRKTRTPDGQSATDIQAKISRNKAEQFKQEKDLRALSTPAGPPLPSTADLAMVAKLDQLLKLGQSFFSASNRPNNTGAAFSRSANRTDGISN